MYAVIRTGGKQYTCKPGDTLEIEKLVSAVGDKLELNDVLFVSSQDGVWTAKGELDKVKVVATVVKQFKDDKVLVFKYKPKKNIRKLRGHRQLLTQIKIDDITWPGKSFETVIKEAEKPAPKKAAAKKPAAKAAAVKEAKPVKEDKVAKPKKAAAKTEIVKVEAAGAASTVKKASAKASVAKSDTDEAAAKPKKAAPKAKKADEPKDVGSEE